jgi:hypothetical protein
MSNEKDGFGEGLSYDIPYIFKTILVILTYTLCY